MTSAKNTGADETTRKTMMPATMASNESDHGTSLTGFTASYTSKDLILYALALGFGSDERNQDDELRYLFERHPSFSAVPSFPLVLPFWADRSIGSSSDVKSFPPPMMKAMGVLPLKFLRTQATLDETLPVIHTSQTITWHRPVPIEQTTGDPTIHTSLSSCILSVAPKSVGTFVTSETKIWSNDDSSLICTMQNTNLVLGMPLNDVIPYGKPPRKRQRNKVFSSVPVFEWTYNTLPTQALLYRIASGDSNIIHVDPSTVSLVGSSKRPLLHGLCTLGIAARGIMKFLKETTGGDEEQFVRLEAVFSKPALVGDAVLVRIWEVRPVNNSSDNKRVLSFQVLNSDTGDIVIVHGVLETKRACEERGTKRAKL